MSKRSGFYPRPVVDRAGTKVVSQAGGVLLTETVRAVGLDSALSAALARWRRPLAVHDPATPPTGDGRRLVRHSSSPSGRTESAARFGWPPTWGRHGPPSY